MSDSSEYNVLRENGAGGETLTDLREAYKEMIFRLALMAEYRDPETGSHLIRISDYSALIAMGMGLPPSEVELIKYASPMHDVGKIILPDKILKKKGSLTAEELLLVRQHPLSGADIFKNGKTLMMKACHIIALTHHERYDGSGYPRGLKGNDIPIYGRIVGLADCFDALTSKRAYKKAYGFEKSFSMILEGAGTHFDPEVVKAFGDSRDKVFSVWRANRDIEEFLEESGIS